MRGFFATLPAGLSPEDIAVVLAEAELIDAWNRHYALFDSYEAAENGPPFSFEAVEIARQRTTEAGLRLANLPVTGLPGLAVKVHHLAHDALDGHTAWAETLARKLLDDLQRLMIDYREHGVGKSDAANRAAG